MQFHGFLRFGLKFRGLCGIMLKRQIGICEGEYELQGY